MKLAAAAYPLDWFDDIAAWQAKAAAWVADAAGQGADLLVFPEYGAMELASLGGPAVAADNEGSMRETAAHEAAAAATWEALARATAQRAAARGALRADVAERVLGMLGESDEG